MSWTASTDNVGVTGYKIFRDGTLVASVRQPGYTDTGLNPSTTYNYTVAGFDAVGNTSAQSTPPLAATTASSTDITPPSVPSNISLVSTTSSSVKISWTASTDNVGVAGYKIYRNGSLTGNTTATSYTDTGLTPSTAYSYTVAAYDAAGNTSAKSSPPLTATTASAADTTPPSVPKNVALVSTTSSSISLTWTASTDNVGVAGYKIFRNGTLVASVRQNSYTDTGLAASTTYSYAVAAFDAAANTSAQSSPPLSATTGSTSDTTPPSVPTNVVLVSKTSTSVQISWSASIDNTGVAGYKVYRNSTLVASVRQTTYTDTGLAASTTYNYTVAAYDASGNTSGQSSPPLAATTASSADTTPPSVPTNVAVVSTTSSSIKISWTASTDNVGVTGYKIYRNGSLAGNTSSTSFTDSGLTPSTTYNYTVAAYDAAGNNSAQSSPALSATTSASADTTPPSVPTNVALVTATSSSIKISWTASTDNVGVSGYKIYRNGTVAGNSTSTTYTDSGLTPSTTYSYTVAAYDAAGNTSAQSSPALSAATKAAASIVLPLRASANNRYLVDQNNKPVLLVGDAPHTLFVNLSESEAQQYFADRAAHGVNAVWIEILVNDVLSGRADGSTYDGIVPFTTPDDFSTPNPAYFQRVDDMVNIASQYGITVFMDALENDGWLGVVQQNGATNDYNFGAYLGNRYKNFPNVIWIVGNDFQTWQDSGDNSLALAIIQGILSADQNHLLTTELSYNMSGSLDDTLLAPYTTLAGAYTYYPPYYEVEKQYNNALTTPVFLEESYYEGDDYGALSPTYATTLMLRKIAYESMLSGSTAGYMYGSQYWRFQAGWQTGIDSPGADDLTRWGAFFNSIAFYNLVPDQSHTFVISGYGTPSGNNSGNIQTDRYVTAALDPNGALGVVYLPATGISITVDMTNFSGPVSAQWFDPTNATSISISGSPFSNTGSQSFTVPGANSAGDPDWVLLFTVQ